MAERIVTEVMRCAEAGTHDADWDDCTVCGGYSVPTHAWICEVCRGVMERYRGGGDQMCGCGAWYNAGGQRLRDDWYGNLSNWNDDVSDLDGFEAQHAGDW